MGFSVFWMITVSQAGGFFGLIFFFIGFGVSFGAPIQQPVAYKNTECSITDQQMITQTRAIGLDTRHLDLDKIQEVYVQVGFIEDIRNWNHIHSSRRSSLCAQRWTLHAPQSCGSKTALRGTKHVAESHSASTTS
jgi:hypothetical protein